MALIIVSVLLVLVAVLYWRTSRAAYESAKYAVVRTDGDVEVRDYEALVLAELPMADSAAGRDGSFMRLFRFIAGANSEQQKIAMTTPVLVAPGPTDARMAFVLPAKLALSEAPKPTDQAVVLRNVDACRYAVLRFSGSISEKSQNEAHARLQQWMENAGLEATSRPQYAYYDPPWTPPFLRRNEVLVRIASDSTTR
jgi:DNA gyrase inhibitor GyrI